jgi:hypothetical protein
VAAGCLQRVVGGWAGPPAPPYLCEQRLVAQQLALGDMEVAQEAGKGGVCVGRRVGGWVRGWGVINGACTCVGGFGVGG